MPEPGPTPSWIGAGPAVSARARLARPMTPARRLSELVAALMAVQASLGLALRREYRDVDWIVATWFGNDWVTLVVAVPLLVAGLARSTRGSLRARLIWLGLLGYAVYNYAFYLLGAALNVFFPLYVAAVVLAAVALIRALSATTPGAVAAGFSAGAPVRLIGGCLLFIGCGLAAVWIWTWAAHVFAGHPTPVEPEAFRLVAALDLSLMVPALTSGGALLWQRRPWGYVIAAIAGIQGSLYLLVLSVNAVVLISRGLSAPPGELPIWGTLLVITATATLLLLRHAGRADGGVERP